MEVFIEYGLVFLGLFLGPGGLVTIVVGAIRRSRQALVAGVACVAVAVVLLTRMGYAEFWLVDGCLDSGGRWNDAEGACER
jgi:hypothetical protein